MAMQWLLTKKFCNLLTQNKIKSLQIHVMQVQVEKRKNKNLHVLRQESVANEKKKEKKHIKTPVKGNKFRFFTVFHRAL
jgi:hypothetical protein